MIKDDYKIRYYIEPGSFKGPERAVHVRPGIYISPDNYGYADGLFVVSVVDETFSMFSTEGNDEGRPSRALLLQVRNCIDHMLEKHTEGDSSNG